LEEPNVPVPNPKLYKNSEQHKTPEIAGVLPSLGTFRLRLFQLPFDGQSAAGM